MAGRALVVNKTTAKKTTAPPTTEQIRQRAYELYLEGGSQAGKENEHWLQAEAELAQKEQETGGDGA